jgi:four helix bundle protein
MTNFRLNPFQNFEYTFLSFRLWILVIEYSMQRTNFENLQIYQLAERLSDEVWKLVADWDFFAKDTVGKQIVRAADSIGANRAEGNGRGSEKDNQRFLRIARGSLYETKHWLKRAYKRGLLQREQAHSMKLLMDELLLKLNACLRAINQNMKS